MEVSSPHSTQRGKTWTPPVEVDHTALGDTQSNPKYHGTKWFWKKISQIKKNQTTKNHSRSSQESKKKKQSN